MTAVEPASILAAQGTMARRSYMVGLVLTILVLVGVVEFILMLVLELEEHVPAAVAAAIDAVLLTVVVTPLLWLLVVRKLIRDLRLQSDRVALAARGWATEIESTRIDSQIVQGVEICDTEAEILGMVRASVGQLAPGCDAQLLLVDSGQANLGVGVDLEVGGRPGCPVRSPAECPAVRGGHDFVFPTSDALDICPKLRDRRPEPLAALCFPISVLGSARGVLHVVGDAGSCLAERQVQGLRLLCSTTGSRLTMIRALADSQLEASVDPLTGLLNRRSLDSQAAQLDADAARYAVAVIDLDRFKEINDTHGHLVGDKSLRLFAQVMRETLRQGDLLARVGGDEFVAVLPGLMAEEVSAIVDRLRENLAGTLARAAAPPFSISVGAADSAGGRYFSEVLTAADEAMYRAKNKGRDRLELAS